MSQDAVLTGTLQVSGGSLTFSGASQTVSGDVSTGASLLAYDDVTVNGVTNVSNGQLRLLSGVTFGVLLNFDNQVIMSRHSGYTLFVRDAGNIVTFDSSIAVGVVVTIVFYPALQSVRRIICPYLGKIWYKKVSVQTGTEYTSTGSWLESLGYSSIRLMHLGGGEWMASGQVGDWQAP